MLQCCRDRSGCQIAGAERNAKSFGVLVFELTRDIVGRDTSNVESRELAIEDVLALALVLVAILQAKPVPDLGARPRARKIAEL